MINIVGINSKVKGIIKVLDLFAVDYLIYTNEESNFKNTVFGDYSSTLKNIDKKNKTIVLTPDVRVLSYLDKDNVINLSDGIIMVRGAGDLATGVIVRLVKSGYKVIALEIEKPSVIRTNVSFAPSMYTGSAVVNDVKAEKENTLDSIFDCFSRCVVPVIVDENLSLVEQIKPEVIVDAIIAKRNLGLTKDLAPLTIALGPGFECGKDADYVIETQRGHDLGRILIKGKATENTGIPGVIKGHGIDRVVKSSFDGVFTAINKIGDVVSIGDVIAKVDDNNITATMSGQIRGMLSDGLTVTKGFKVADIDPRINEFNIDNPSDKAFSIAGSVLEIVDSYFTRVNKTL